MKKFWILLKRELTAITREKTIMFAIMIQFVIASLSTILLTGIMAFYDPSSISQNTNARIRVGLVHESPTPMINYLAENGIRVNMYPDMPAAREAFSSGRLDAVMLIPVARSGVVDMQLILPALDTSQTVVLMMLQEPLKKFENYLRAANGIKVNYANLGGKPGNSYEFLYTLIIPILMLFPALITGSIIIDTISEEFQNKTFETLLASPISISQIFNAKLAAAVFTALGQVVLWVVLLRFNGTIIDNPLMVILMAVMSAAVIAFIAAFTALYFKDRERSQFIYSLILVVVVTGSYFLDLSPVSIISTLASGSGFNNLAALFVYPALLVILGPLFFIFSRRLVYRRN
ncbi:MAG TPA: ABC transporter permease [Dehalococcoidales bacterium]|nr:ABC transporter permease [Dehalococcoidales bacterium]